MLLRCLPVQCHRTCWPPLADFVHNSGLQVYAFLADGYSNTLAKVLFWAGASTAMLLSGVLGIMSRGPGLMALQPVERALYPARGVQLTPS